MGCQMISSTDSFMMCRSYKMGSKEITPGAEPLPSQGFEMTPWLRANVLQTLCRCRLENRGLITCTL